MLIVSPSPLVSNRTREQSLRSSHSRIFPSVSAKSGRGTPTWTTCIAVPRKGAYHAKCRPACNGLTRLGYRIREVGRSGRKMGRGAPRIPVQRCPALRTPVKPPGPRSSIRADGILVQRNHSLNPSRARRAMEAVLAIGELGDFLIKDSDGRLVADDKQIKVHCNDVF